MGGKRSDRNPNIEKATPKGTKKTEKPADVKKKPVKK